MITILKKVGTSGLLSLFIGNYDRTIASCSYRSRKPTQFAVRLNNEQIHLYSPISTLLQEKCPSQRSHLSYGYSTAIKRAGILTMQPG